MHFKSAWRQHICGFFFSFDVIAVPVCSVTYLIGFVSTHKIKIFRGITGQASLLKIDFVFIQIILKNHTSSKPLVPRLNRHTAHPAQMPGYNSEQFPWRVPLRLGHGGRLARQRRERARGRCWRCSWSSVRHNRVGAERCGLCHFWG